MSWIRKTKQKSVPTGNETEWSEEGTTTEEGLMKTANKRLKKNNRIWRSCSVVWSVLSTSLPVALKTMWEGGTAQGMVEITADIQTAAIVSKFFWSYAFFVLESHFRNLKGPWCTRRYKPPWGGRGADTPRWVSGKDRRVRYLRRTEGGLMMWRSFPQNQEINGHLFVRTVVLNWSVWSWSIMRPIKKWRFEMVKLHFGKFYNKFKGGKYQNLENLF